MLILLFILLLIGFVISYLASHKNILSAWVLAHVMYMVSVFTLFLNYENLKGDISLETVVIIISSIAFIGIGELFVRNVYFKKNQKYYYPSSFELTTIPITKNKFVFSIVIMTLVCIYDFYSFNVVGSYMGGSDFASKYLLIRSAEVSVSNGGEQDFPSVPLGLPMAYLEFFVRILAYFYIFIFLYHKTFKIKNQYRSNYKNLIPVLIYLPICFFTLSRSIFINLFETFGVIYFIMLKQSKHQWNNTKSNLTILKKGAGLIAVFFLIFAFVGTFKDSDVSEDVNGTLTAYAGAGIYGLDEYMKGKYGKDSDYLGQNTLSNVYIILNKFGFNYEMPRYHNEPYVWGKHGEVSNIVSSPFYLLIDYPLPVVLFIYFLLGAMYSFFMNALKFGVFKIKDFDGYVISAMVYYSVFMIAITEDFHHNIGSVFVYSIICVYIIKHYFITKPMKVFWIKQNL